ncbi:MAG: AAA family ATPase [Chloroflexota bacterium]
MRWQGSKTFFKNVKGLGANHGLDRVFMTSVSSIVLNDVTSGANVFKNISWRTGMNDFCGFTHDVLFIQPIPLKGTTDN